MGSSETKLSPELEEKVLLIFQKMDTDGSKVIERNEAIAYWKGKFAAVNAEAMFSSVDRNNDGSIQLDEWQKFWRTVKSSGHSEEEIAEELDSLLEGGTWVGWEKMPKYTKSSQKHVN